MMQKLCVSMHFARKKTSGPFFWNVVPGRMMKKRPFKDILRDGSPHRRALSLPLADFMFTGAASVRIWEQSHEQK
jgi:hypothetical protein